MDRKKIIKVIKQVANSAEEKKYYGFDPYDIKAEPIFKKFNQVRYLSYIQDRFLQINPMLLRKVFNVTPSLNSKALALFVQGYCNLFTYDGESKWLEKAKEIILTLSKIKTETESGIGWGYPFDWQSRVFFPAGTPSGVVTSFCLNSILNWMTLSKSNEFEELTKSAAEFLYKDLNMSKNENNICFSYTPQDNFRVHNANVLVASALLNYCNYSKEEKYKDKINKAYSYTIAEQNEDGSWDYFGRDENLPGRIDNYHTGFVLKALLDYYEYTQQAHLKIVIEKGFNYYVSNLFFKDFLPKFNSKLHYPIDIHACADSISTLSRFKSFFDNSNISVDALVEWTIKTMYDQRGAFYYQNYNYFTSKVIYMRWNNAWMFYALTEHLKNQ